MPSNSIEGFPLTEQQRWLWHLQQQAPGAPRFLEARLLLKGKLETEALREALRRTVARHEILRTKFLSANGDNTPLQVVEDKTEQVDLSGKFPGASKDEPVLRCNLEQLAADSHRLTILIPSICADLTSLQLLFQEVAREYENASLERDEAIEPMQYLDYGQWQSDLQDSQEARSAHAYWNHLEAAQPVKLPLERPAKDFRPETIDLQLPRTGHAAINAILGARNLSAESVYFAAWTAFCARLTGQRELISAVYSEGRSFEELESALGVYDRFLPLRLAVKENTTALDFIRIASAEWKKAQQYHEYYRPGRSSKAEGHPLLFRHVKELEKISKGGIEFALESLEATPEWFKLFLEVKGTSELRLSYNRAVLSEEAAKLFAERFLQFIQTFAQNPEKPILQMGLATEGERRKVIEEFAYTRSVPPKAPTVLDLYHSEVDRHSDRPAVIWNGQVLSYAQLEAQANRLANHLLKLGIKPGTPVALSTERSFEMIIGLLGILKAGGAYVPIDPGYPKERIRFVLDDIKAPVLVIQPHLISGFPEHPGRIVALAETNLDLIAENTGRPEAPLSEDGLAYVIYTSGSTGQPKGVPITHRNLACSTAARLDYYQQPVVNYLLLSSFSFDSSIAGIFWALAQGGALTLPKEGTHGEPKEIARLITEHEVSHMLALPSLYSAILDHAKNEQLSNLKTVIVAGEACPPAVVQRHYKTLPGARLYNEYGPTEGTVWSTVHQCERDSANPQVPIGRPVANMGVYILDEKMEPVPIGCEGEIHITGDGLTTGYLNRPDLTGTKFVANPFKPGSKLYKTGDLGRFMADGNIEFLGRMDHQVKIRGYRIELGEIEAALLEHPEVKEAVVLAREDSPGEKRLVAYVSAGTETPPSVPDLRLFLQDRLPQFMVPAQFAFLTSFPQTPNGKVDRKALPAPEDLAKPDHSRYVAPRNPDEDRLAQIWAEVLKMEKVGAEENFFELGGHSLLAIQVIARVRETMKVEIPMRTFFDTPTVAGMAVALERCRQNKTGGATTIKRVARAGINPAASISKLSN